MEVDWFRNTTNPHISLCILPGFPQGTREHTLCLLHPLVTLERCQKLLDLPSSRLLSGLLHRQLELRVIIIILNSCIKDLNMYEMKIEADFSWKEMPFPNHHRDCHGMLTFFATSGLRLQTQLYFTNCFFHRQFVSSCQSWIILEVSKKTIWHGCFGWFGIDTTVKNCHSWLEISLSLRHI